MTNFPESFDVFPDFKQVCQVRSTEDLEHCRMHTLLAEAITNLQQKVGIDGSDDPDSLDYKLNI